VSHSETASGLYEVEVVLPGRTSFPFRVSAVEPARAWQVIDSFLAAYGLMLPRNLRDLEDFVRHLVDAGEYRSAAEEIQILVKAGA
jgi:hypothetical protein